MDTFSFYTARWPLIGAVLLLLPLGGMAAGIGHSAVLGILAMLAAWMAWNWPGWLLLGLVIISPIARSSNSAALPLETITYAKTALALLLGFTWTARRAVSRDNEPFPRWLGVFFFLWASLTLLAVLHTEDGALTLNYLYFVFAGLSVFCVSFHQTMREKRRLLWAVLAGGLAIGLLVLLQYAIVVHHVGTFLERYVIEPRTQEYYAANPTPFVASHYRASGTLPHPNAMGLYFALLIPFAVALLGVKRLAFAQRAVLACAVLIMAAGLYATDSRAAAVYLFVAMGYMTWHAGYRWIAALGVAGILVGALGFALYPSKDALLETLSEKSRMEYGLSGRPAIWENTETLVRESPLLGKGPGNFSTQYVAHFGFFAPNDVSELMGQIWSVQMLGDRVIENFHAHNIYLQLAGEIGVLGPLLFLASVFAVIFHCERHGGRFPQGSFSRAIALATAADAVGLLAYGVFDSQLIFTIGSLNLLAGPLLAVGLNPSDGWNFRT